jgi:hypothetical protein
MKDCHEDGHAAARGRAGCAAKAKLLATLAAAHGHLASAVKRARQHVESLKQETDAKAGALRSQLRLAKEMRRTGSKSA